jgi:hypothetical protein
MDDFNYSSNEFFSLSVLTDSCLLNNYVSNFGNNSLKPLNFYNKKKQVILIQYFTMDEFSDDETEKYLGSSSKVKFENNDHKSYFHTKFYCFEIECLDKVPPSKNAIHIKTSLYPEITEEMNSEIENLYNDPEEFSRKKRNRQIYDDNEDEVEKENGNTKNVVLLNTDGGNKNISFKKKKIDDENIKGEEEELLFENFLNDYEVSKDDSFYKNKLFFFFFLNYLFDFFYISKC